ncbi:MAG: hypothetical protein JWM93_3443 [Frankiales bacterium]|nr:hypothetical protein [Frankiales bacterium]
MNAEVSHDGNTRLGTANGGSSAGTDITSWVMANFTASTVGGVSVYDLTAPNAAPAGAVVDGTTATT